MKLYSIIVSIALLASIITILTSKRPGQKISAYMQCQEKCNAIEKSEELKFYQCLQKVQLEFNEIIACYKSSQSGGAPCPGFEDYQNNLMQCNQDRQNGYNRVQQCRQECRKILGQP